MSPEKLERKKKKRERLLKVLTDITNYAEIQVCQHEETFRGGAIWEICHSCGAKWADDEGGKPEFVEAPAVTEARKYIQELLDARKTSAKKKSHVCGLQGFGALDDHCPACSNKE